MPNTLRIHVPHLGGIEAGYQMPKPYDSSKPVAVLVNSFTTSAELYQSQFEDSSLTENMNLLAIEPLGHGETRAKGDQWTFWDTAIMNLQALDNLDITSKGKKVILVGTSQGGWIAARMALLAPEKVAGMVLLGTSMDYESERTRKLGCWDGPGDLSGLINGCTSATSTPSFEVHDGYCEYLISTSFGPMSEAERDFWTKTIKDNYRGDDGRRRMRMAAINLSERDGLHGRVSDVQCPILWMHGTADKVYSVANAREEIELFTGSPDARLEVVEEGRHFLSFSSPKEINAATLKFVNQYGS